MADGACSEFPAGGQSAGPDGGQSDAEEGEIVDDEEEAEETADDKHTTNTPHSSKSTSSDKQQQPQHRKPGPGRSGRDSSTRSKSSGSSRKRHKPDKESGGDAEKAKKARGGDSDQSSDESGSGGDDSDPATKQRLMMQMMQIMLNASKQGKKSDRKTIELMDKMIKRGSDVSAKEVREIVRKNKRLLRAGSRDRRSRSRSRDRRSRRTGSRDKDDNKLKFPRNQSPDRVVGSGLLVDPRTGVGLLKEKCKFFAEGKCHKGFECPFSHEIVLTKKREICKFYLQGYCGKGEHCFFMHEEFPCKFFHTGADCYSGDKCRFSHQPLTEEGRSILRGYLDSGELPDDHIRNRQPEVAPDSDVGSAPAPLSNQSAATAAQPATTTYQPVKPVPKRHAILGDVTDAMRTSYYTWMWQQELKELEMAYTGNKRNLFCVEKQFIVTEKPETPPPEDPDEAEFKVFSFYTDTMGDVDIRQFQSQPPPSSGEPEDLFPLQNEADEEDLFLMSAAHDEDLRVPPPQWTEPVNDPVQTGTASDGPAPNPEKDWISGPETDTQTEQFQTEQQQQQQRDLAGGGGGGDSPSAQTESRTKPKYDIAKMLNVIRQSTNQSNSASPAVPGHSDFWQNIFSGTSFAVGSSPTSSSSAQMSPSQVKDPRLKKDQRQEDSAPSALHKQSSTEQGGEDSEFRLVAVTVPGIDYSDYVSLYHNDCKLKNDPRLQKFFTRSSSLDQLTQLLPPESSSKSFMSSTITQSTLASLMSTSGNHTSSPAKFAHDQDDRLTPTSPPHLPALPPLTLNQVPKSPIVSLVPPPPPAMTPLELMTSKPMPLKPLTTAGPPQLSLHSYPDRPHDFERGGTGNGTDSAAMDLSAKKVKDIIRDQDDDTPASPASRRSSCDTIPSPPLIQAAADDCDTPEADPDLKNVFGSIDPTASPFC